MSKPTKPIIIGLLIIIAIFIGFTYLLQYLSGPFTTPISSAYKTECQTVKIINIGEFTLEKRSCLGPYGPHSYPYILYKNGEQLDGMSFEIDTCILKFDPTLSYHIEFNICDSTYTEFKPDKKNITLHEVDSIIMLSVASSRTKKLSKKESTRFINDWNKATVFDYRAKTIFYPTHKYEIFIYANGKMRKFIGSNFMINDGTKWVYLISKNEDIEYFDYFMD